MGLLDFLQTPQGQALASGVATYAATARRGTPINNIGRGVLGGITGYGNAVESQQNAAMQAQKDAYNQKQQELLGLHYGNEKYRVETERKRLEQQRQAQIAEAKMFLPGFVKASGMSGQGFDFDEEGNIVPVEMPNAQPVSANVDWMQGADDEYKSMIASAMQSGDPTVRRQAVNEMYRYYRDARKGTKAGDDLSNLQEGADGRMYGYDKTTNTMVPVGGDFKPKEKKPVVDMSGMQIGTKEVAKDLAGPVGQRADASLSMAEGAVETMTNANMVRNALNKGMVIAGPMAGIRMKWAQIKNLAGFGDTAQLEATRNAIQGLASLTLDSRASLKGQGQITEGETKLLERARSGNIEDMTVDEIQTVVDVSQRLATRQWENHQNLLGIMKDDPAAQASLRYYKPRSMLPGAVGRGSAKAQTKDEPSGFNMLPNANEYDGKTIRDTKTGKRYKSSNGKWTEVK